MKMKMKMKKSFMLGYAFLLVWVGWVIYGANTYQGTEIYSLFFLTVGGVISFPLYFGILYLIVGNPRKKWIAWLVIALAPFTLVPATYLIFGYFY